MLAENNLLDFKGLLRFLRTFIYDNFSTMRMRILAFTDMHGSTKAFKEIIKKSKKADILICCGDLTIFEQYLKKWLMKLNKVGKPVLIIPGNHESPIILKKVASHFKNIIFMDARSFEMEEYVILGAEGNGFSMVDKAFNRIAKAFNKILKKNTKKYILMTHAPPHNTKLDKIIDGHCGNKSIRNFILKSKPVIAFCGHIHENNGKEDRLEKTRLINPGPYGQIVNV